MSFMSLTPVWISTLTVIVFLETYTLVHLFIQMKSAFYKIWVQMPYSTYRPLKILLIRICLKIILMNSNLKVNPQVSPIYNVPQKIVIRDPISNMDFTLTRSSRNCWIKGNACMFIVLMGFKGVFKLSYSTWFRICITLSSRPSNQFKALDQGRSPFVKYYKQS
ncbi:unnamed protein product (macronuclear) [Paramecium tetraurelia]|uniref:Uncharacterized protein n=1 Tax=Paramecium tetraurelia TaxID=5888 RepID=A0EA91_PARTE|nr:uncharacterized protein GSPATT00024940001 [Paramecium tetraurelia]CAK92208.1 unnamed protein product [Paramecium tetraurelia]|eukprot:XP_001459605.1 hypothetical protein (macronuclear) [Paramecium tetraurelia strain d4-2]